MVKLTQFPILDENPAMKADYQSSPASSGGDGTFFEQHVNAYWLAHLVTSSIPPILLDTTVEELVMQTCVLGWHTDDFLLTCRKDLDTKRRLVGQVKKGLVLSANDEDCRKTVVAFWRDYSNAENFVQNDDQLVLVTQRSTTSLYDYFASLLNCARSVNSDEEFQARIAIPGFVNAKAVNHCDTICEIVGSVEGRTIEGGQLRGFLSHLHVLQLDLNTSTSRSAASILSLLAQTATTAQPVETAKATWNELLKIVGDGMPKAKAFTRSSLPSALTNNHSPIGTPERRLLQALAEHGKIILDAISTTLGSSLHLERTSFKQSILLSLETHQIVVLSGPAGCGKSALAKAALQSVAFEQFTFCFRAEEFQKAHLDETLGSIAVGISTIRLSAVLAAQGAKLLLIDSMERLLESPSRRAFDDLLLLIARDPTWKLILTCRDYSVDLVRNSILADHHIEQEFIAVPALTDEELEQVLASYPMLQQPLLNPALHEFLRNPFVLNKALQIDWSQESLPNSRREFRKLFWNVVVRGSAQGNALPRRREEVLKAIALQRARELSPMVSVTSYDVIVVEQLLRDSLLSASSASSQLAAPAHDVLEDWALLQWLDDEFAVHGASIDAFATFVAPYPAFRRAYRIWLEEMTGHDSAVAFRFFEAASDSQLLAPYFKDDTIAAILRSTRADTYLGMLAGKLFGSDKALFWHLEKFLRVACVETPSWATNFTYAPVGSGWPFLLRSAANNLTLFSKTDCFKLLRLIEAWARGVSPYTPYPAGSDSAINIAFRILGHSFGYDNEDHRKRALEVIAQIPMSDKLRVEQLLTDPTDGVHGVGAAFRKMVIEESHGMPLARDLPNQLVSAIIEYIIDRDANEDSGVFADVLDHPEFGLRHNLSHHFFPASAYHGAFFHLFRYNPQHAFQLLHDVFNYSADVYINSDSMVDPENPPVEISIRLSDTNSIQQVADRTLWCLYRGSTSGPFVLQSFLMALEKTLLELAEVGPELLDSTFLRIMSQSRSIAVTAVVASVAVAFPHDSPETLLILLAARAPIQLDKQRLLLERQVATGMEYAVNDRQEYHQQERTNSNKLKHRSHDLETAIANLQLGKQAARVQALIDELYNASKQINPDNEDEKVWRLALRRMDMRSFKVKDQGANTSSSETVPPSNHVELEMMPLEPDLEAMVVENRQRMHSTQRSLEIVLWAMKVYDGLEPEKYKPALWHEYLAEAINWSESESDSTLYHAINGLRGHVAATCIKCCWGELSASERTWCIDAVLDEVTRNADNWNSFSRMQISGFSSEGNCARILSLLLSQSLTDGENVLVRDAFSKALTHPNYKVRDDTVFGVALYLTKSHPHVASLAIGALATESKLLTLGMETHNYRRGSNEYVYADAASDARERFLAGTLASDSYSSLDLRTYFGAKCNKWVLTILSETPDSMEALSAFERTTECLCDWWDGDRQHDRQLDMRRRSIDDEQAVTKWHRSFLFFTSEEHAIRMLRSMLARTINAHPSNLAQTLRLLISLEDRFQRHNRFWVLWNEFALAAREAKWIATCDDRHSIGADLISELFLGTGWKREIRHWVTLEVHPNLVTDLFADLASHSFALMCYLRFLYKIGDGSLPDAFILLSSKLSEYPQIIMGNPNSVFYLERIVHRCINDPSRNTRSTSSVRSAILHILDVLVDNGSPVAYKLRDDFVTPSPSSQILN